MIVGLTGGIGSGKTWVSSLFKDLGIPVYISDIEAKKIMHNDVNVKKAIINLFGDEAYLEDKLNRGLISNKVFKNKSLLNKLNAIVHPAVAAHFDLWYRSKKSYFVIKESAILFEMGGENKCDLTILITAPIEERIRRVQLRDNSSVDEIRERINNQWSDIKKVPLADYVISNVLKEETICRVQEIYKSIVNKKINVKI